MKLEETLLRMKGLQDRISKCNLYALESLQDKLLWCITSRLTGHDLGVLSYYSTSANELTADYQSIVNLTHQMLDGDPICDYEEKAFALLNDSVSFEKALCGTNWYTEIAPIYMTSEVGDYYYDCFHDFFKEIELLSDGSVTPDREADWRDCLKEVMRNAYPLLDEDAAIDLIMKKNRAIFFNEMDDGHWEFKEEILDDIISYLNRILNDPEVQDADVREFILNAYSRVWKIFDGISNEGILRFHRKWDCISALASYDEYLGAIAPAIIILRSDALGQILSCDASAYPAELCENILEMRSMINTAPFPLCHDALHYEVIDGVYFCACFVFSLYDEYNRCLSGAVLCPNLPDIVLLEEAGRLYEKMKATRKENEQYECGKAS